MLIKYDHDRVLAGSQFQVSVYVTQLTANMYGYVRNQTAGEYAGEADGQHGEDATQNANCWRGRNT